MMLGVQGVQNLRCVMSYFISIKSFSYFSKDYYISYFTEDYHGLAGHWHGTSGSGVARVVRQSTGWAQGSKGTAEVFMVLQRTTRYQRLWGRAEGKQAEPNLGLSELSARGFQEISHSINWVEPGKPITTLLRGAVNQSHCARFANFCANCDGN